MQNTINKHNTIIGIDVSKHHLDIYVDHDGVLERFTNDGEGIRSLLSLLLNYQVNLVVAEATGGLELPMLIELYEAGYGIARVNPRWIKDFARARGKRAKTDLLDAQRIADYGRIMQPDHWQPLDEDGWTFKDLCARRRQLVRMLTMELNRSQQCHNAYLARQHQIMIHTLKAQIREIETILSAIIERSHALKDKSKIICSVPGDYSLCCTSHSQHPDRRSA